MTTERKKDVLQPESISFPESTKKERTTMSNNNNQINIPQAREAGSVGGQMVSRICYPKRGAPRSE